MDKLFALSGRVALVTGGGGLLGSQISRALAEAGAQVAIAGRSRVRCEEAAHSLGEQGLAVPLDVTRPEQVMRGIKRVVLQLKSLDILVNAAGIARPVSLTVGSLQDWLEVLKVNLTGTFLCSRAAGRIMMTQHRGKIINIASIYGLVGVDKNLYGDARSRFGSLAYAASKGGVISLTRDMAIDLAPYNVQVNAISPGAIRSRQRAEFVERYRHRTPLGRLGEGTDLKGSVVFLASSASDYMTGQNLVVDGGFTAW